MAGRDLRFRSKIDAWFIVVIMLAVSAGPIVMIATTGGAPWLTAIAVSLVPIVLVIGLLTWMITSTSYVLSDTELTTRCGPVLRVVRLAAIRRITPSRSVLSAPALSLDRLAIECGDDGSAVISPADKGGFIRAIRERVPGVVVESGATG
jgi:prepilin signal peptidase PulO-like enzyme (type II secretory pathway)